MVIQSFKESSSNVHLYISKKINKPKENKALKNEKSSIKTIIFRFRVYTLIKLKMYFSDLIGKVS